MEENSECENTQKWWIKKFINKNEKKLRKKKKNGEYS